MFSLYFNSFQFYEKEKQNILCEEVANKVAHYKEATEKFIPATLSATTALALSSLIVTTCLSRFVFIFIGMNPEI